jgi:uncharacterized membrane protein YgaE (UPF0421/DUF939 family)
MERSSVELSRFKVNIPIITTAEEAYLREKVAVKNSNNKNNDDNKKKEELARLEKVAKLLEIGSSKFMEAMSSNSNDGKRKELLEQAFHAYVEAVPYLGKMPYLTVPVLQQIHNIERMLEAEMERSVNGNNDDDGTSNNVDEVMKVARESLL